MNDLIKGLTIHQASERLRSGQISSVELTEAYFHAIEALNPTLNCYITTCRDLALDQAKRADERLRRKHELTPLTGVPLALKDIFVTQGIRTTCGSQILTDYVPPYSGTVVTKLEEAGAVLLGKLNMDEFAMGSSNEHSAFGPVKNPWKLDRIPGGSSGGSAAAVAADLCAATLGTDTGGSIRQPAAMCGIVGLKPTYGRVSRYGIIAFASSLDQVGPMTKDVRDSALLMNAIAGNDPMEATSLTAKIPDYTSFLDQSIKGLRLGIPEEYFIEGIDPDVRRAVEEAITTFERLGATRVSVNLKHTPYAIPTYYIIAPAEASSNLARYDGIRFGLSTRQAKALTELYSDTRSSGFGPEVTLRITIGTFVLSSGYYDAYYLKAQKVRRLIAQDFLDAFQQVDAILTPTTPTTAFPLGDKTEDPVTMYLNDIFTCPANLAGLPALSLPCGMSRDRLPIGMQLIGKPLDEGMLLRLSSAFERETEWHAMKPPL